MASDLRFRLEGPNIEEPVMESTATARTVEEALSEARTAIEEMAADGVASWDGIYTVTIYSGDDLQGTFTVGACD